MMFDGKRALVTGAGKGIGRTIVADLVARGATVVAVSRTAADLADLPCETVVCDLEDLAAAKAMAEAAGPIDCLVNNAGIARLSPLLETSMEEFDTVMAVNTKAPLVIAQVVAKGLIARGAPGAIVNVSSTAARLALKDHASYCASKAALDALTRVMAVELGAHGIRVNSVNPVITMTPMATQVWSDPEKSGPMLARVPAGRFVEPEEVAKAVAFLLSDEAAMVHGHSLAVDGGFWAN
ncbi:MAG: SDR family oxidoreductase [Pseudomonadota bacterium]